MRKLKILQTIVDLFWFFCLIIFVAMVAFAFYSLLHKGPVDIPIKLNGTAILIFDIGAKMLIVFGLAAYCFFVYGIYQLRKLLSLFEKRVIFEERTIWLLNQIGKSFLATSVLTGIPLFIYNVFHGHTDIYIDLSGGFSSFLFTLGLGLFFMVLSEVFNIAKNMKEENELTV